MTIQIQQDEAVLVMDYSEAYSDGFAAGSDDGYNQGYMDGARETRNSIAMELTRLSEDATFFADRHIYGRAARIAKEAGG